MIEGSSRNEQGENTPKKGSNLGCEGIYLNLLSGFTATMSIDRGIASDFD